MPQDIELDWTFTSYAAKLNINKNKNRYVNIIPCKCTVLFLAHNSVLNIVQLIDRLYTHTHTQTTIPEWSFPCKITLQALITSMVPLLMYVN